jgi:O-antigen ligase
VGYHADRARGPFLQAVANGVTLTLLGLVALDSHRRGRLRGPLAALFLIAVPVAVVATKTRAVWISFVVSVLLLLCFSQQPKIRRACLILTFGGSLCLLTAVSITQLTESNSFSERLVEQSPIEFRKAIYDAGLQMVLQKPITGWGAIPMRAELGRRISDFHQESFFFHNTFLEITVQYGLIGLFLYAWLIVDLFRLGRARGSNVLAAKIPFADAPFRSLWPVMLVAYLFNACFVVMNYQFVNGLLFTFAGLLAFRDHADSQGEATAV